MFFGSLLLRLGQHFSLKNVVINVKDKHTFVCVRPIVLCRCMVLPSSMLVVRVSPFSRARVIQRLPCNNRLLVALMHLLSLCLCRCPVRKPTEDTK